MASPAGTGICRLIVTNFILGGDVDDDGDANDGDDDDDDANGDSDDDEDDGDLPSDSHQLHTWW